jgi:valyl-tRNA synthetase
LGNSPDALELIETFGADGVRFGVLSSSPAGGDLLFDDKLCEQGRNFCNKIWNALRLIKGWEINENITTPIENVTASLWIEHKFNDVLREIDKDYKNYRLSDVTMKLYNFVWNDFCSWYLEMIKPDFEAPVDRTTYEKAISMFEQICISLHPLMPFITEEIWHHLKEREAGDDCIVSKYPEQKAVDKELLSNIDTLTTVISKIREIRSSKGLKARDPFPLFVEKSKTNALSDDLILGLLKKMAFINEVHIGYSFPNNGASFLAVNEKYFLQFDSEIDVEEERDRLQKELDYAVGFLKSVERKLSNEKFVNGAPEAVVDNERKKLSDGQERVRILEESLAQLN